MSPVRSSDAHRPSSGSGKLAQPSLNDSTESFKEGWGIALVAKGVSKVFVGQVALDQLDLTLRSGEIHALLGENGSGKSTFIKILSGYHLPDGESSVQVGDSWLAFGNPKSTAELGMRFVHQDRGLVDELSIVDNLGLVNGYQSKWWISVRNEARLARDLLADFGIDVDGRVNASQLTSVERTILAIGRALHQKDGSSPRVLVLDEPTESLSKPEVELLFRAVRKVVAMGTAVLYVSHNVDEVLSIATTISVLRNGRLVATLDAADLDRDRVIELIVGRKLAQLGTSPVGSEGESYVQAAGIWGRTVSGASFEIRRGEILGIAGVAGSGSDELPYLVGGARPWDSGTLVVGGELIGRLSPHQALAAGIVFVSQDRTHESAIPSMKAFENVTLPGPNSRGPLKWLSARADQADARDWMLHTDVRPCEPGRDFATFSGGNQQKLVLARAFRCAPKLLVLDHPVQGVDIGAKFAIYAQLREESQRGLSILVAGDPEDLAAICDRVLIMRDGQIVSQMGREELSVESIVEQCLSANNGST